MHLPDGARCSCTCIRLLCLSKVDHSPILPCQLPSLHPRTHQHRLLTREEKGNPPHVDFCALGTMLSSASAPAEPEEGLTPASRPADSASSALRQRCGAQHRQKQQRHTQLPSGCGSSAAAEALDEVHVTRLGPIRLCDDTRWATLLRGAARIRDVCTERKRRGSAPGTVLGQHG